MEDLINLVELVAILPALFFLALNSGKLNAACAVATLIYSLLLPIFFGLLIANKKIIYFSILCQLFLLSVIFMIYDQWVIVILIAAGIICIIRVFEQKCL